MYVHLYTWHLVDLFIILRSLKKWSGELRESSAWQPNGWSCLSVCCSSSWNFASFWTVGSWGSVCYVICNVKSVVGQVCSVDVLEGGTRYWLSLQLLLCTPGSSGRTTQLCSWSGYSLVLLSLWTKSRHCWAFLASGKVMMFQCVLSDSRLQSPLSSSCLEWDCCCTMWPVGSTYPCSSVVPNLFFFPWGPPVVSKTSHPYLVPTNMDQKNKVFSFNWSVFFSSSFFFCYLVTEC